MSVNESTATRGHLRRILALTLIVTVVLLIGALGTMAYWARAVDHHTALSETALVERTLDRRRERITADIVSSTVWDDAWKATVPRFDPAWTDANFGQYYNEYMHHDRTVGYDGADRLVYASRDGTAAAPATAAAFSKALTPLLSDLRRKERTLQGHRPGAIGLPSAVNGTGVVQADGETWLVAASSVAPESPGLKTGDAPAPVVISARRLGPEFLAELEKDLGVAAPRLLVGDEAVSTPVVALKDVRGQVLARLTWTPAKPGLEVLKEVMPLFLAALALIFAAGGALGLRIHHALQALARNDRALEASLIELTRARDRAEAASVAKSQFLANISHEIRTPLNGVLGMAQIMERGALDDAQRDRLSVIRDSGKTLLRLLNDVLDLAKIEAGKLEINRTDVDLEGAVQAACDTFRCQAVEKRLDFGVLVEPEALGLWRLDGMRLTQVLGNLVSNAVKFTAVGHVSVRVWRSERGLEFAVMDTGPGIPPDRVAELFDKFNQLDASTTRQFGGTGLGLAICRELVELMDGELTVESTPGKGSLFSFHLPAQPAERRAAA